MGYMGNTGRLEGLPSRSTADLLTVVSDRIARAFNKSGATRAVAFDIYKAFGRVWLAILLLAYTFGLIH